MKSCRLAPQWPHLARLVEVIKNPERQRRDGTVTFGISEICKLTVPSRRLRSGFPLSALAMVPFTINKGKSLVKKPIEMPPASLLA
jgi:hypothetical protein